MFLHCCVMTNISAYTMVFLHHCPQGEEERAIYSSGCFLTSTANESRIPSKHCPLSPYTSHFQYFLFPSTSLWSLPISACAPPYTPTSWCFSPSITSFLGSSEHSFGSPLFPCLCIFDPETPIPILFFHLFFPAGSFLLLFCFLLTPIAETGWEALLGLG